MATNAFPTSLPSARTPDPMAAPVASVSGSLGTLTLPGPFYRPGDVLLSPVGGGRPLLVTEPGTGHDALFFEAAEVARCVDAGLTQTPLRPLADSIATLQGDGRRPRPVRHHLPRRDLTWHPSERDPPRRYLPDDQTMMRRGQP